jgi:hypothetical protein
MKKRLLALALVGALLTGAALALPGNVSWGDEGFYVVATRNPNIITTDTNTAIGKNAFNATSTGTVNTACGVDALHGNITGSSNTACGANALHQNSDGSFNTACGSEALYVNNGNANTACGMQALAQNNIGSSNTASGIYTLSSNSTGSDNTASGREALFANYDGSYNTAVRRGALSTNRSGNYNIAVGAYAGYYSSSNFSGNENIYLGHNVGPASLTESNTIRIGGANQSKTYVSGIYGTSISSGANVLINSAGQLGTAPSSRRYKEDIRDMGEASDGLMKLRPVAFHYKREYAGGPRPLQYGLIAEEVAEVYPEVVLYNPKTGQPETVAYHLINTMLLNEVQKQHRLLLEQEKRLQALAEQVKELAALKEQVGALQALAAVNQEGATRFSRLADQHH